ncbi:MAG TPA: hypothetical protein VI365_20025, partial [Trebonia sp.]
DGVAAIRGMSSGHRPSPGKGVVSGISSFVGSSAFAAALSSASAAPSGDARGGRARKGTSGTPAARDGRDCLPAAAACVDLTGRIPWPQDDGAAGFGPLLP